jgi:hypothetical protein
MHAGPQPLWYPSVAARRDEAVDPGSDGMVADASPAGVVAFPPAVRGPPSRGGPAGAGPGGRSAPSSLGSDQDLDIVHRFESAGVSREYHGIVLNLARRLLGVAHRHPGKVLWSEVILRLALPSGVGGCPEGAARWGSESVGRGCGPPFGVR